MGRMRDDICPGCGAKYRTREPSETLECSFCGCRMKERRLQEQADREHRAWEAIRSGAVVDVERRTDHGPGDDETFFLAHRLRSTDAKRRADPVDAVLAALETAEAAGEE